VDDDGDLPAVHRDVPVDGGRVDDEIRDPARPHLLQPGDVEAQDEAARTPAVEVALTSHQVDRRKATLYATAGAPMYWLVDIPARRVIAHEGPSPDGTWRASRVIAEDGVLELPTLDASVPVSDVLPPAEATTRSPAEGQEPRRS
jgi:Putative restriction endonuclease